MSFAVRPISNWPTTPTPHHKRRRSPFRATYSMSEDLLLSELRQLQAKNTVLEVDVQPWDLRLDGTLRANARPQGPRVCLYADTKHGPLMMPCDSFFDWQDNVRAIALSLEALRKVDRYGCALRGEQYRGWTALPERGTTTRAVDAAWATLGREAHDDPNWFTRECNAEDMRSREELDALYRDAARRAHPDAGGTDERMAAVNRARDIISADLLS